MQTDINNIKKNDRLPGLDNWKTFVEFHSSSLKGPFHNDRLYKYFNPYDDERILGNLNVYLYYFPAQIWRL